MLERLAPSDLVLDVGGWAKPLGRANWVLDLMPYETRGLYGRLDEGEERFGPDTWIVTDMCDRKPWPFSDDQFDFVVCSHTLEDVRDPIWVASELNRVARAGYVEVPSRIEEQCWGVHGPWVGWSHHRWLVDATGRGLEFVLKPGVLNGREDLRFPPGIASVLTAEERVHVVWWEGSFECEERMFFEPDDLHDYLGSLVERHLPEFQARMPRATPGHRARQAAARLLGRARRRVV